MPYKLFLILPLLFGLPAVSVNWTDGSESGFTIRVLEHDPVLYQCRKSGLEVIYRFDMRLCQRQTLWLDTCKSDRREIHSLEWEPVSETFKVVSDRHGDADGPVTNTISSFEEALADISTAHNVPLGYLSDGDESFLAGSGLYLRTKVSFTCKGQYSQTMDRLSSILTLGLVSVGASNSGWIDFDFQK